MSTLAVPSATAASRRPLSTHGMPKPPRVASPELPHRFSAEKSPSPSFVSSFASPRSIGPMSPPMSAKSFGTFIDSEPSTPAYSPRMDYEWDDSTLVLMRPMSSSSEPSSPTEPAWDIIMPVNSKKQPTGLIASDRKEPILSAAQQFFGPRLNPVPTNKAKARGRSQSAKEIHTVTSPRIKNDHPQVQEEGDAKENEEPTVDDNAAPLVKLASKVKFMLRRRSATTERKKEKKEKDYYEPEEYLHWSER